MKFLTQSIGIIIQIYWRLVRLSVQDKKCSELPQTLAGHAFEVDSLKPFYSRRFQGFVLYLGLGYFTDKTDFKVRSYPILINFSQKPKIIPLKSNPP